MGRLLSKPWHESFHQCVSPHTDAPDNFIRWSALSLIGAALKNNVHFDIGTYTLYPNQFIVLVAPPGIGKGTAMNMVEDIINENKVNPVVNTLNDRITAEKIIERIADGWQTGLSFVGQQLVPGQPDHNCMLFSTEIRTLLGASDWMLEFLEEAWSKTSFSYQTKNKGSVKIESMCCSLLAASVPDFLRNINREVHMVITGGFSSRCLFIYADKPSKDLPFPTPLKKNPRSKDLFDKLCTDLREISTIKGEYQINTDARLMFTDFLKQSRADGAKDEIEAVINFRARIKAHILKLAMIFSASKSNLLMIDRFDMYNAISEVQQVLKQLEKLFRGAGDSLDAENTSRVQQLIEKRGMCTKKELLRSLHRHMTSETLDRILHVLTYTGFCHTSNISKQEFYVQTNKNGVVKP